VANPTNSDLISFINQGFKPGDLNCVGRSLRAEIEERANQIASVTGDAGTISGNVNTLSGNLDTLSGNVYIKTQVDTFLATKASLSTAVFTGAVTVSGIFTATSGTFITTLINAADDTAAQASGVSVNQLYRTGSAIKVRVS
jgi:hypothetical protein